MTMPRPRRLPRTLADREIKIAVTTHRPRLRRAILIRPVMAVQVVEVETVAVVVVAVEEAAAWRPIRSEVKTVVNFLHQRQPRIIHRRRSDSPEERPHSASRHNQACPAVNPEVPLCPPDLLIPRNRATLKCGAHDVTVQAGKTYRYKLRYYIANPVARSNGLCANPADAKKFWIQSPDSAWTDPISVEADTNFFAVEQKHGIHFDVFKWKNGLWQMQSVTANPGDMVGTVDTTTPARTDFTTGWTLVDVREEPNGGENDRKLILVSDNGTVIIKELATDQHSSKYRELYNLVNKDKTNPVAAGSPQLPPPIN